MTATLPAMPWIKRKLRGNKVFVRVDEKGAPITSERGLVEVVYKMGAQAKIYKALVANLVPTGNAEDEVPFTTADEPPPGGSEQGPGKGASAAAGTPAITPDAIIIYTDGACSGNPGPMGIGAVIVNGGERQEISEFLGIGTNNIAELTAIERALQVVPPSERGRLVVVHTDSSYSIGLLEKGWKAKANTELVARIRQLTKEFGKLRFVKVKGHAGIPENERCDLLATSAITAR
jgi:ribonuclease HI